MEDLDSCLEESLRRLIIGSRFPEGGPEVRGSSGSGEFSPSSQRYFDNVGRRASYFSTPNPPAHAGRVSPKKNEGVAPPPQAPPVHDFAFPRAPQQPFTDFFPGASSFPPDFSSLCVGSHPQALSSVSSTPTAKHEFNVPRARRDSSESANEGKLDASSGSPLTIYGDGPRGSPVYAPASPAEHNQPQMYFAAAEKQAAAEANRPVPTCAPKPPPLPPPSNMMCNSAGAASATPDPPLPLSLPAELMNSGRDACVLVTLPLCLPYGKILNVCGESETSCCKRNYYCISPKLHYAAWKLFAHSGGICDTYAAALHVEVAIIHVPEPLLPQVAELFMKHAEQSDFHFDTPLTMKCGNLQERPAPVRAGGKVLTLECFFNDPQERKKLAAIEQCLSGFRTELEYIIAAHRPRRSGHSGRKPNIWRLSRTQSGWRNGGHHRAPRLDVTVRAFQQQRSHPAASSAGIQEASGLVADVCASEIRLVTTRSHGQLTTKADPRFPDSKVGTRCLLRAPRAGGPRNEFPVPCRKVFAPQQVPEVLPLVFRPGSLISQEQQRACVEWEVTHRMERNAAAEQQRAQHAAQAANQLNLSHFSNGGGLSLPSVSIPGLCLDSGDLGGTRGCDEADTCLSLYGGSPAGDSSSTGDSGGSLSPPGSQGRDSGTPGSCKQADSPAALLNRLGLMPWKGDVGPDHVPYAGLRGVGTGAQDLRKEDTQQLLRGAAEAGALGQSLGFGGGWPAEVPPPGMPRPPTEQGANFTTAEGSRLNMQSQDLWVFLPALLDALRAGGDAGHDAAASEGAEELAVGDKREQKARCRAPEAMPGHHGGVGAIETIGASDRNAMSAFSGAFEGLFPAARAAGMEPPPNGAIPCLNQQLPGRRTGGDPFTAPQDVLNGFLLSLTSTSSSGGSHQ
ncbi:hypothetical protein BESB_045570 [Besnoitia besnoiti]|uniref:Uncharacterized protein n=1 Tax=Besnoitia besnoiti TaxID=94643 RepID=A0A2A9MEF5_BESBE|nr:hypothetical protein BESB_045570 [Besnoitia besnoiti]PFH36365.1 hypothetical protein BESB_045570 [Besnoitia besnoiti]